MREATSVVVKRHYGELSPEETSELVEAIADLIVDFLKGRRNPLGQGNESGAVSPSDREGIR